jgi:hypothetical protein
MAIKAYGDMDMPSGFSWNGFVIEGTEKSIKEVARCVHEAENVEFFWRPEVIRLRKMLGEKNV